MPKPDMHSLATRLDPGLYLVATPIGAARDITLRSLDILANADVLAAEDTRSLRRLMEIHGIKPGDRPLVAYHDHNGDRARPRLLAALAEGKSVVYASEAGTPMVADPGFDLARAAVAEGHTLISAPGPSAVITALTLAGLPTDRFFFAGFLPPGGAKRKTALEELAEVPGTLVFYESPKRVAAMLRDAAGTLGAERQAAVCRELTKKFEEVLRGSLEELAARLEENPVKGEIVVVIDRGQAKTHAQGDIDTALRKAMETQSLRDAAEEVARELGLKRRAVYQRGLEIMER